MESGLVSNIQKFSLHDGPGIRTTVFLKGCPMRCAWCHNPENMSRRPEVVVFEARCIRCMECVRVCPKQNSGDLPLTGSEKTFPPEVPGDCELCGACVEACSTGARAMMGQQMTVAEVLEAIRADRIFYEESQGGVTFSGGEPLAQFQFLKSTLLACKEQGIHTAVDTCGYAATEHLLEVAPLTGLFLYDIKFIDNARHQEFTGVSNELILANLRALAAVHPAIWMRVPIIPGVNDGADEVNAIAELAGSLPAVRQVNLLPYHKTGIHKFKRIGKEYQLPEVEPPSAEEMDAVARPFVAKGLKVKIGG